MPKRSDKSKECDYLSFGDAFPPTSFSFEAEGICMTFQSLEKFWKSGRSEKILGTRRFQKNFWEPEGSVKF
jgi:hypothetical protein